MQCLCICAVYPRHGSTSILMYSHLQIIAHLHFFSCGTGVRVWTVNFFEVAYFLPTCTLQGAVHGVLMVLMMKMRLARSQRMNYSARKWLCFPESPGQADKCQEQWWKERKESRLLLRGALGTQPQPSLNGTRAPWLPACVGHIISLGSRIGDQWCLSHSFTPADTLCSHC